MNPAIALGVQSTRPAGRVAEIGSLGGITRMANLMKSLSLLALVLWIPGCASLGERAEGHAHGVYPGARYCVREFAHPPEGYNPWIHWLVLVDLPFSTVFDTVALPFDLPHD